MTAIYKPKSKERAGKKLRELLERFSVKRQSLKVDCCFSIENYFAPWKNLAMFVNTFYFSQLN